MVSHLSLPRGRAWWRILLLLFCFVPPLALQPVVPKTSVKERFSVSGSQEEDRGEPCIMGSLPSSFLNSRQQWVDQENSSCPFVELGCSTRVPASNRHRPGHHRPRAGSLFCTSLPLHGYVGGPVGPAGTVSLRHNPLWEEVTPQCVGMGR